MPKENQIKIKSSFLSCPLCCSSNTKSLFIKSGIPYFSCRTCLFVFSSPGHNANLENKIDDFESSYLQYFEEKKSDPKNHSKMLTWIRKVAGDNTRTLLDIGCGSGKFVNFLNRNSELTATGIEPSLSLFNHFLSGTHSFIYGTIHDFTKTNPGITFDVITVFDVLEHTPDPVDFLSAIQKCMHPSSFLFMSMPDVASFHRNLAGKRWHYFNKYHFSYFSKKTLELAARKAGLILVSCSHQSRFFQTRYVWDYFKNFVLGKKTAYSSSNNGIIIPLNLFDNMYCVLKKGEGSI